MDDQEAHSYYLLKMNLRLNFSNNGRLRLTEDNLKFLSCFLFKKKNEFKNTFNK